MLSGPQSGWFDVCWAGKKIQSSPRVHVTSTLVGIHGLSTRGISSSRLTVGSGSEIDQEMELGDGNGPSPGSPSKLCFLECLQYVHAGGGVRWVIILWGHDDDLGTDEHSNIRQQRMCLAGSGWVPTDSVHVYVVRNAPLPPCAAMRMGYRPALSRNTVTGI